MLKTKFALPFLCAAGTLVAPFSLLANPVSENTTLRDINEFSAAYTQAYKIESQKTLTFHQGIDGAYAGTISGKGTLKKTGNANLVFEGSFDNFGPSGGAYVSVEAGTLTFNDNTQLFGTGIGIANHATLIFNCGNTFGILKTAPSISVSDSNKIGIVENVGSGTVYLATAEGAILNVRAGKLVFSESISFSQINVGNGAELCIGNGNATGTLSGNIELAEAGTLRFNQRPNANNPLVFGNTLSGNGEIVFDGDSPTYLGGNLKNFTGTLSVNAGTALLWDTQGESVETRISRVSIRGGSFGGNGSVAGSVDVYGKYFAQSSKDQNGGVLDLTLPGSILRIGGNLNFDSARQEPIQNEDGSYTWRICDRGGQTEVNLGKNGCGRVEVAGTANLAGMISLSGDADLAPGKVAVFLHADNPIQGDFQLVSTTENIMLVSPGIAGIGFNEYGIASIENRKLRERPALREHDGISEFVDYLAEEAASNRPNEVAQAVNLAMGETLNDTINNFSPLAHCSLSAMAVRQSNLEVDYLTRILEPNITAPRSPDGLTVPANTQYFTTLLTEFVDNDDAVSSPIFNIDSIGVMSGIYRWVDGERLVGASLAVHHGTATPHGFSDASFADTALRFRAFAAMVPANASWNLLFGASAAVHYYDIDHATGTGTNHAEEGGLEAGAFFVWQMEDKLSETWTFRPFARFDLNYIRVDTVREEGSYSALKVDAFGYTSIRPRVGFGLEKMLIKHDQSQLNLGVDFSLVAELGKEPEITSRFQAYENSETTIRGTVEERGAFEITPRMDFHIKEKWTIDAACRLQMTPDGGSSAAFSIGINSHF